MAELLLRRRLPLETPGDGVNVQLGFLIEDTTGELLAVGGRNNSPDTFHIHAVAGPRHFRTTLLPGEDWRRNVPGAPLFCTQRADGRWRLPFDRHSIERVLAVPLAGSPTVLSVTTTITFSAASGTAHVFDLPATVDAGDLLDAYGAGTFGITAYAPNSGWTEIGESGDPRVFRHAKEAVGSEDGGTATATSTGSGAAVVHVYRIQAGTWGDSVTDLAITFAENETANPDPPNHTPAHGSQDYLLLAGAVMNNDGEFSDDPDGYANAADDTAEDADNDDIQFRIVRRTATIAAENPTTFTWFEADLWTAFTASVPPPLSAGGGGGSLAQGGLIFLWAPLAGTALAAELASESDVAQDATLRPAKVLAAELATGSDTAQDAVLRAAQVFTAELAIEGDTALDAAFSTARALPGELATESDVAGEAQLAVTAGFSVELPTESDVAADAILAAEPVFTADLATCSDIAENALWRPEVSFVTDASQEADVAQDAALRPALALSVDLATESDVAVDVTLGAQTELQANLGSESDVAADVVFGAEPVFTVELATESDVATDQQLVAAAGFTAQLAIEADLAFDAALVTAAMFDADLAAESDVAANVTLTVEPPGPWWIPDPVELADDPVGLTPAPVVATRSPRPYTRQPVSYTER